MHAPKRVLPPALAANRWRPGQSGNPLGHSGAYGEAMKIARSYAPAAMHRLAELAELDQFDSEGNLVPLSDLPDADRRVIAVAANSILDRAFGKPKVAREFQREHPCPSTGLASGRCPGYVKDHVVPLSC